MDEELKAIVRKMIDNGEDESSIDYVISQYNSKKKSGGETTPLNSKAQSSSVVYPNQSDFANQLQGIPTGFQSRENIVRYSDNPDNPIRNVPIKARHIPSMVTNKEEFVKGLQERVNTKKLTAFDNQLLNDNENSDSYTLNDDDKLNELIETIDPNIDRNRLNTYQGKAQVVNELKQKAALKSKSTNYTGGSFMGTVVNTDKGMEENYKELQTISDKLGNDISEKENVEPIAQAILQTDNSGNLFKKGLTRLSLMLKPTDVEAIQNLSAEKQLQVANLKPEFSIGLNRLKYSEPAEYERVKKYLTEGTPLSESQVAKITSIGLDIKENMLGKAYKSGELDEDTFIQQNKNVTKDRVENLQGNKETFRALISQGISDYLDTTNAGLEVSPLGGLFGNTWYASDAEIESIGKAYIKSLGLDPNSAEAKDALQYLKDNEGVLPLQNSIAKSGNIRDLFKGAAIPIRGIANTIEGFGKSNAEKYAESQSQGNVLVADERTTRVKKDPLLNSVASIFEGTGQFATQAGLAYLTSAGIGGIGNAIVGDVGLATTGGEIVGTAGKVGNALFKSKDALSTFITSYAQVYDSNLKTALNYTSDNRKAVAAASILSSLEGATELFLSPLEIAQGIGKKLFDKKTLSSNILNIMSDAAIVDKKAAILKSVAKSILETGKVIGSEIGEEEVMALADYATNAVLNPQSKSFNNRDLANEIGETAIQTGLTMVVPALGAGVGAYKANNFSKGALMIAGQQRQKMVDDLNKGLAENTITQDQYNEKVAIVNAAAVANERIPLNDKDEKLTPSQKADYIYSRVSENILNKRLERLLEDKSRDKENDPEVLQLKRKIAAQQNYRSDILQLKPMYFVNNEKVEKDEFDKILESGNLEDIDLTVQNDNATQEKLRQKKGVDLAVGDATLLEAIPKPIIANPQAAPIETTTTGEEVNEDGLLAGVEEETQVEETAKAEPMQAKGMTLQDRLKAAKESIVVEEEPIKFDGLSHVQSAAKLLQNGVIDEATHTQLTKDLTSNDEAKKELAAKEVIRLKELSKTNQPTTENIDDNETLKTKAKDLIKPLAGKGEFMGMNEEQTLKFIASQAQNVSYTGEDVSGSGDALGSTTKNYGEELVNAAIKLYPRKSLLAKKENTPQTVEQLREAEQAEYNAMSDPNDEVEKQKIYDKYDKLITPLLEKEKVETPTQESTPKAEASSVGVGGEGFKKAGEKARDTKDATHIGRWMLDNSQKGDVVRFQDGGYEVTEVNTKKDGTKELVLTPFEFNEDGSKDYNNTGIKIISEQSIKNGSNLFENAYTNSKGERVIEQSTYEPVKQSIKETTKAETPSSTKLSNNSKAVVEELKTKKLTTVPNLGMGAKEADGMYISTEKSNRYATEDNPAKEVSINIENPKVTDYVENTELQLSKLGELINNKKIGINDISEEYRQEIGDYSKKELSKIKPADITKWHKETQGEKINEDLFSQTARTKAAKLITEQYKAEGYDSLYFPSSETQEGYVIVFDKNHVNNKTDNNEKDTDNKKDKPTVDEKSDGDTSEKNSKKARTRVKGTRKANRKIKHPTFLKALDLEVTDPYDVVLQYFIGGGKINSSAIKEIFANGKKSINAESQSRIDLQSKEALNIARLSESLQNGQTDTMQEIHDDTVFREAIESVLIKFNTRMNMANDLLTRYKDKSEENYLLPQFESIEEQKQYEDFLKYGYNAVENESAVDEAVDYLEGMTDEQIEEMIRAEEEGNEAYFEALIKEEEGKDKNIDGEINFSKPTEYDNFQEEGKTPATKESIQKAFPQAIVVQSQSELPKSIQDAIEEGDTIEGVELNGKVYLVADNLPTMEIAAAKYKHEYIGHKGVIAVLKDKLDTYAIKFFNDNVKGKDFAFKKIAKTYAPNIDFKDLSDNQKSRIAQEYFAQVAEKPSIAPTVYAKIKTAISSFLRKLGIDIKLNDNDVKVLLDRAIKFNEKNTSKNIIDLETKNEIKNLNLQTLNKISNEIINGTRVSKRYSQGESKGIIRGGEILSESILYLGANESTSGEVNNKENQEGLIEKYAKAKGVWVNNTRKDLTEKYGQPIFDLKDNKNQESIIFAKDKNTVVKSQNTAMYGFVPINKLDSIVLQNTYFEEAGVKVIGFGRDENGDFQVIVEQEFIKAHPTEKITQEKINEHLSSIGFTKQLDNSQFTDKDNTVIVDDLHTSNAILTPKGNIVVFDPLMRMNTAEKGYGGTRIIGNDFLNNQEDAFVSSQKVNIDENGNIILERLRQAEEQGRIRSGEANTLATIILSRLHRAVKDLHGETSQQYQSISNEEEAYLEDFAKQQGIWVEEADKKQGNFFDNGQEQRVYIDPNNTKVVNKINDGSLEANWLEFLDRIALHNANFGEGTAYTLKGFGRDSNGKFVAILEQPYITPKQTTEAAIKEDMAKRGFEPLSNYDDSIIDTVEEKRSFINKKTGVIVEDLHLKNVFDTGNGKLAYIDPVISLDTADRGYGGTRTAELPNLDYVETEKPNFSKGENEKSAKEKLKEAKDSIEKTEVVVTLSEKNKKIIDNAVESIIDNKTTKQAVKDLIQKLKVSDVTKEKLNKYLDITLAEKKKQTYKGLDDNQKRLYDSYEDKFLNNEMTYDEVMVQLSTTIDRQKIPEYKQKYQNIKDAFYREHHKRAEQQDKKEEKLLTEDFNEEVNNLRLGLSEDELRLYDQKSGRVIRSGTVDLINDTSILNEDDQVVQQFKLNEYGEGLNSLLVKFQMEYGEDNYLNEMANFVQNEKNQLDARINVSVILNNHLENLILNTDNPQRQLKLKSMLLDNVLSSQVAARRVSLALNALRAWNGLTNSEQAWIGIIKPLMKTEADIIKSALGSDISDEDIFFEEEGELDTTIDEETEADTQNKTVPFFKRKAVAKAAKTVTKKAEDLNKEIKEQIKKCK